MILTTIYRLFELRRKSREEGEKEGKRFIFLFRTVSLVKLTSVQVTICSPCNLTGLSDRKIQQYIVAIIETGRIRNRLDTFKSVATLSCVHLRKAFSGRPSPCALQLALLFHNAPCYRALPSFLPRFPLRFPLRFPPGSLEPRPVLLECRRERNFTTARRDDRDKMFVLTRRASNENLGTFVPAQKFFHLDCLPKFTR